MKKKLPNIYKGIVKNTNQNQKQSSVFKNNDENIRNDDVEGTHKSINRQIKDIFSSPKFVYKSNVLIKLNDGTTQEKTIIGRTNNSLITIDDELIEVNKINRIDFLD